VAYLSFENRSRGCVICSLAVVGFDARYARVEEHGLLCWHVPSLPHKGCLCWNFVGKTPRCPRPGQRSWTGVSIVRYMAHVNTIERLLLSCLTKRIILSMIDWARARPTPPSTFSRHLAQGTFTYPDGKTYSGDWLNGLRHGEGTRNYPDGSTYTGSWIHDKRHGRVRQGLEQPPPSFPLPQRRVLLLENRSTECAYRLSEQFRSWKDVGLWHAPFRNGQTFFLMNMHAHFRPFRFLLESCLRAAPTTTATQGTYMWKDGRVWAGQWIEGNPVKVPRRATRVFVAVVVVLGRYVGTRRVSRQCRPSVTPGRERIPQQSCQARSARGTEVAETRTRRSLLSE